MPHARHTAAEACSSLIDKFIVVIVFLLLVHETTSTLYTCNTNSNTIINFKIYSATSDHTVPTVHAVTTPSVERHRIWKAHNQPNGLVPDRSSEGVLSRTTIFRNTVVHLASDGTFINSRANQSAGTHPHSPHMIEG
jgi:hypothetical protein